MGLEDPGRRRMKKKKQLSLAQALGDLSKIDPKNVVGRKVVFNYYRRKPSHTHREIRRGKVIGLTSVPGFVLIEDEKGNQYSRDLSNIWGDVLE
jgi:hypothetical protein